MAVSEGLQGTKGTLRPDGWRLEHLQEGAGKTIFQLHMSVFWAFVLFYSCVQTIGHVLVRRYLRLVWIAEQENVSQGMNE